MKTIEVGGMSCNHCVMSVTKALSEVSGLKNVSVSLEKGLASFDTDKDVDPAAIKAAISRIGFVPGEVK